jgi:hypothetical protein
MSRPAKLHNLLAAIRDCVESGRYLDTRHAFDRKRERQIMRPEVLFVLRRGHHEKKKDKFDEQHEAWNYAIRGKTVDRREILVVVSFDPNGLLIITAIDLR